MGITSFRGGFADALFSQVQQRVLGLIFSHPERSFYTSEIIRSVGSGVGAVERELAKLERSRLVLVHRIGNQKHYRANEAAPIFQELRGLVAKTVGIPETLKRSLSRFAETITAAFVFGSVVKQTDSALSDIDVMVIGDHLDYVDLYSAAQDAEQSLGRKVSPIFLSVLEWQQKASEPGSVIQRIAESPKIFIIGSEKDLPSWVSKNSTTL